jgi:two-component system sensor histidine kinase/response regulator
MTRTPESDGSFEAKVNARDRRRAEFVGTVSHDLKTPLNAIVGFTSVLLADASGFGPEQTRQLRLVYDSARSLLKRINDLLEFHRLEAGKMAAESDWFYAAELVIQLVESHRDAAEQGGATLRPELTGGPARLRSDARLLRRILDELLSNGIRFGGGEIRLSISSEQAPDDPERSRVRFLVSDGGSGFSDERRAELSEALDPRIDDLDRSYAGLGLGLALAREAASLLGGWIELAPPGAQAGGVSLVIELPTTDLEA